MAVGNDGIGAPVKCAVRWMPASGAWKESRAQGQYLSLEQPRQTRQMISGSAVACTVRLAYIADGAK
eukprot:1158106-Pelagomonas_calceolata.AAC.16